MAKQYKLTPKHMEELKEELNYLKTVREKEVAELIKEARSFGDLSENSEYDEAKNEQGKLFPVLRKLRRCCPTMCLLMNSSLTPMPWGSAVR